LDEILDLQDDELFNQCEFQLLQSLKEEDIFESTGDQIRVTTKFPLTDKLQLEPAKSANLRLSAFPLGESKSDLFDNIDFSNSMRMGDFSNLNSNYDVYMSEVKSSKLKSDMMIDLNLDDVAEDDFDFFGSSGAKSALEKPPPTGPDVFSPFSPGSTPDIFSLENAFSPHTPVAASSVPAPLSYDNYKNIPSDDTAVFDSFPSNNASQIIPKKVSAELMASSVDMIPSKWLPFKFQDGKPDILEKYGHEKGFTFMPAVVTRLMEIQEDNLAALAQVESSVEKIEEVKMECFVAGHPLDIFCDFSDTDDTYPHCTFKDLLPDYPGIHLSAKFFDLRRSIHKTFLPLSHSCPDVPISWTEFAVNLVSTRFGGDMTQLNLQQYFDLQGII
jgi:hypothetical protein